MSEPEETLPTGMQLSALDPVFRECPHKYLDQLRSKEPVHRDRVFDRVVLTRAEDVGAVLNDRTISSDPRKSRPGSFSRVQLRVDEHFQPSMLHLDDPDHKRVRTLVSKAFTPTSIDAMRPRIAEVAGRLLDEVATQTSFDVMEAYAKPLPTVIIAHMLGIDEADQHLFKRWSDTQIHLMNPLRTPEQQSELEWGRDALNGYLAQAIAERSKNRGTDLIRSLITAEEGGEQLDEAEIINICQFLLVAGNITTTDLIGNGVLALLRHPEQLAKLVAHPALARNLVEEVLRYDAPIAQINRVTTAARQIAGIDIEPGQTISSSLLAANNDPSAHPNPRNFDIERPDKRHHAFGGGAHFCLGAPLARAEAEIGIPLIFTRSPKLRLMSDNVPLHRSLPGLNGVDSLWVSID